MKGSIRGFLIIVLFFMMVSCATTQRSLPQKYNLDDELETVSHISINNVSNCENVDDQSIILEADHNHYYLLVLRQPIATEYSHLPIGIENTASSNLTVYPQEKISSKMEAVQGPNNNYASQAPSKIKNISSGHHRIIITLESQNKKYIVIEKIYRLDGKGQAEEIKKRLRRERRVGHYI